MWRIRRVKEKDRRVAAAMLDCADQRWVANDVDMVLWDPLCYMAMCERIGLNERTLMHETVPVGIVYAYEDLEKCKDKPRGCLRIGSLSSHVQREDDQLEIEMALVRWCQRICKCRCYSSVKISDVECGDPLSQQLLQQMGFLVTKTKQGATVKRVNGKRKRVPATFVDVRWAPGKVCEGAAVLGRILHGNEEVVRF